MSYGIQFLASSGYSLLGFVAFFVGIGRNTPASVMLGTLALFVGLLFAYQLIKNAEKL